MKSIVSIIILTIAAVVFVAPPEASAQRKVTVREKVYVDQGTKRSVLRSWRRNRRSIRNTHGYRNYGQYRRTQVGNRRFRLVRQYYTRNGRTRSRMTKIYY